MTPRRGRRFSNQKLIISTRPATSRVNSSDLVWDSANSTTIRLVMISWEVAITLTPRSDSSEKFSSRSLRSWIAPASPAWVPMSKSRAS